MLHVVALSIGKGTFLVASQVRRPQARGKGILARVSDTAGRERKEVKCGWIGGWHKVAVDIQHNIGRVRGKYADSLVVSCWHDDGIGLDSTI